MSANEEQDWSDSLDFESLAEEHTGPEPKKTPEATEEDFGDTFDGAFADETGDDLPAEASDEYADEVAEADLEVEAVAPPPRAAKPQRSKGVSGTGLGVLFAFSIMVAAVGSGGALLVALGIDPANLWRPEGLSQLDQLLNLDRNPLNLVYIVVLATVLLTLLGAWAVARSVRRVGERAEMNATLLDRIAILRIDEDRGWQDPLLKKHPTLSAFVDENIGAWRLNGTRQKRSAGLEGEVQRLTRALTTDNREDLSGRYDHPSVGSLSDEIVRVLDERGSATPLTGTIAMPTAQLLVIPGFRYGVRMPSQLSKTGTPDGNVSRPPSGAGGVLRNPGTPTSCTSGRQAHCSP